MSALQAFFGIVANEADVIAIAIADETVKSNMGEAKASMSDDELQGQMTVSAVILFFLTTQN